MSAKEFPAYLTRTEKQAIVDREERCRQFRRSLPKRKKPDNQKPGALLWIQT